MQIKFGFQCEKKATVADLQAEVGRGWSDIVGMLVDDLFALGWNGEVLQIKEKFGGLRFYIGGASDYSDSLYDALNHRINLAEEASFVTCEECGDPGVLRKGGWLKTLCDVHAKGREPYQDKSWLD